MRKLLQIILMIQAGIFSISLYAAEPEAKERPITPTELVKAYRENSIAADRRFTDKRFPMLAFVAGVGVDSHQQPYIAAFTNYPGIAVKIEADSRDTDILASLHRMDAVRMTCLGEGLDTTGETPVALCSDFVVDQEATKRAKGMSMPAPLPSHPQLGAMP